MVGVEGLRPVPGEGGHSVLPGRWLGEQFLESRLVDGWPLQQRVELRPSGVVDGEVTPIRQILLGGIDRMADDVIRDRLLLRGRGRFDDLALLGRDPELEPV